jgi:hypothetical protein
MESATSLDTMCVMKPVRDIELLEGITNMT